MAEQPWKPPINPRLTRNLPNQNFLERSSWRAHGPCQALPGEFPGTWGGLFLWFPLPHLAYGWSLLLAPLPERH